MFKFVPAGIIVRVPMAKSFLLLSTFSVLLTITAFTFFELAGKKNSMEFKLIALVLQTFVFLTQLLLLFWYFLNVFKQANPPPPPINLPELLRGPIFDDDDFDDRDLWRDDDLDDRFL